MTAYPEAATTSLVFTQTAVGAATFELTGSTQLFVQDQVARGLRIQAGISITELIESRSLRHGKGGRQLTRVFSVEGTDDPVSAEDIGPQIGDIYDNTDGNLEGDGTTDPALIVRDISANPVAVGTPVEAIQLVVTYNDNNNDQSTQTSTTLNLDFGSGSIKTVEAFDQTHYPTPEVGGDDGLEEEWGNRIGPFDEKGNLKGFERLDPQLGWQETHIFATSLFSPTSIANLMQLIGKVNKAAFRGFAAKTFLFETASARKVGDNSWEVSYSFRVKPTRQTVTFDEMQRGGTSHSNVEVPVTGHQYLWKDPAKAKNAAGDDVKKIIVSVSVADVYESTDFGALGIGTAPIT